MEIELRLLRSFVAMLEAASISRAAEKMSCTQAAMSMRLKMLEAEIGATLFLRRPGGLVPTPRGAELYAKALGVLSAYDELLSATRHQPKRPKLRIGMPDDYCAAWLTPVLQDLGRWTDRLDLSIVCDLSANLMAGVERGEIDLALVSLAAPPHRARFSCELPLLWLAAQGPLPTTVSLAAYPEGCVFRRAMTQSLDQAGVSWRVVAEARGQVGIFAAVRAGRAVTAVAKGTAPPDLITLTEAPGLPALPRIALHLVLARPAPRAAETLAERLAQRLEALAPHAA